MRRDAFTLGLDFGHELVVDNFAGGGGASTALFQALGRHPDIAINHDGEALSMHAANHPTCAHYREDVFLIDPTKVTKNRPIGSAWFSPTCTHFSRAKGDNILDQKTRGLAWVVPKWGVYMAPRVMYLENVEEFLGWCPLNEKGKPIKELKGRTFQAFVSVLTTGIDRNHPDVPEIKQFLGNDFPMERLYSGLGYKVEWRVLWARDFGAATLRRRLYMVMRRDGLPIVWPEPTHGPKGSADVLAGRKLPYNETADHIRWDIQARSIFGRKKPLVAPTLRRLGRGIEQHVKDAADPFIVNDRIGAAIVQMGYGEAPGQAPRIMDIRSPLGTIVAGGGKHAVMTAQVSRPAGGAIVAASLMQYYSGGSQLASLDQPLPTIVTRDRVGLATATLAPASASAKQAAFVMGIDHQSNKAAVWSAADPLTAITCENRHAIVVSSLVKLRGTSSVAASNEPLGTISAGGLHHGEVRATLTEQPDLEHDANYLARRQEIREFLWTYCPSLAGAPQPELMMIRGELMELRDIGLRMLLPAELAGCQGLPKDYILAAMHTYTNRWGKEVRKPLPQHAQVRMIGNSVSPPPAVAIIRANSVHEQLMARAA